MSNSRLRDTDADGFLRGDSAQRDIPLSKAPTEQERKTSLERPKHTFRVRRGYKWIKTEDKTWLGMKRKFTWAEIKTKKK